MATRKAMEMKEVSATVGRGRLPLYRKLAFGTGHFLMVLAVSMWFSYSVLFYEKVLKLPASSTGTIVLVSQIFGGVSTPFVGMWSDNCKCSYGRRKIFHLMGNIAVACSFFFIWYDCLGCENVEDPYKVLYYASLAAIFQFGAAVQISQLSLIPELTTDKSVKVELNSIRYAFTIIGNLVIFVCFWVLLEKLNNSPDTSKLAPSTKKIFWIMALVVIVLGVSVSIFFQIFVREDPNITPPRMKWYKWFMKSEFYVVVCCFVSSRMVYLLTQSYLPLYLLTTLQMDQTSIAKGPLVMFVSSFLVTLIVKRFNKFVGDKMTLFIGLAIVWGALIWFWVKDPTDDSTSHFNWSRDNIYGATVLLGAGGAICLVMSLAFISYMIGRFTGSSAYVYGWVLFADRLSNGVAVKIIQSVQPSNKSNLPAFYRNVLVFLPFAASALILTMLLVMLLLEWRQKRHHLSPEQALIPNVHHGDMQTSGETEDTLLLDKEGAHHEGLRWRKACCSCRKYEEGGGIGGLTDLESSMTM